MLPVLARQPEASLLCSAPGAATRKGVLHRGRMAPGLQPPTPAWGWLAAFLAGGSTALNRAALVFEVGFLQFRITVDGNTALLSPSLM